MVYKGSNPIKMDDLGVKPPICGNTHLKNCYPPHLTSQEWFSTDASRAASSSSSPESLKAAPFLLGNLHRVNVTKSPLKIAKMSRNIPKYSGLGVMSHQCDSFDWAPTSIKTQQSISSTAFWNLQPPLSLDKTIPCKIRQKGLRSETRRSASDNKADMSLVFNSLHNREQWWAHFALCDLWWLFDEVLFYTWYQWEGWKALNSFYIYSPHPSDSTSLSFATLAIQNQIKHLQNICPMKFSANQTQLQFRGSLWKRFYCKFLHEELYDPKTSRFGQDHCFLTWQFLRYPDPCHKTHGMAQRSNLQSSMNISTRSVFVTDFWPAVQTAKGETGWFEQPTDQATDRPTKQANKKTNKEGKKQTKKQPSSVSLLLFLSVSLQLQLHHMQRYCTPQPPLISNGHGLVLDSMSIKAQTAQLLAAAPKWVGSLPGRC